MAPGHHVIERRHECEEPDVLKRTRDAARGDPVRPQPRKRRTFELDPSRRRRVDARNQVEDGRLSRAVGADQRDDTAGVDIEGEIVDGDESAEGAPDAIEPEERAHGTGSLSYSVCS
jgi:hypothetical protein